MRGAVGGPRRGAQGLVAEYRQGLVVPGAGLPDEHDIIVRAAEPFPALFAAASPQIDGTGAVESNIGGFQHVGHQRHALWTLFDAIATDDQAKASLVMLAMEYAFARQHADGYFTNGLGLTPTEGAEADSFFLAAYGRAQAIVLASKWRAVFQARLDGLQAGVLRAGLWQAENKAAIIAHASDDTNRRWYAALAMAFGRQQAVAREHADGSMARQHTTGYYTESGGFDSGYQAVSLAQVAALAIYDRHRPVMASLRAAAEWMQGRVQSGGSIDTTGNTRSGPTAAEQKHVNYYEVALGLLYSARVLGSNQLLQLANRVASYVTGFQDESLALFVRITVEATTERKAAIDDLVAAVKAAGVWDKCETFHMLAAASSQAALLNWKGTAFTASAVGTPAFTIDRGYLGSGTTSYLATGYNPTADGGQVSQNSAHLAAWSRTSTAAAAVDGDTGARAADGFTIGLRTSSGTAVIRLNDVTTGSAANADGSGLFVGNRVSSTHTQLFRNGAQLGSDFAAASAGLVNADLRIGGVTTAIDRQWAFQSAGAGLTAQQVSDLHNAVAAYMTAVGAA